MRVLWRRCICYIMVALLIFIHALLSYLQVWAIDITDTTRSSTQPYILPKIKLKPIINVTNKPSTTQDDSEQPLLWNDGLVFNCSNIAHIQIRHKVGQGVTKQVFLGVYKKHKVAVKMITKSSIDVKSCIAQFTHDGYTVTDSIKRKCFDLASYKMMKELLLLQQLQHPNILKLLGFCLRSEETESLSLEDHGLILVYEFGLPFYISSVRRWPWHLRHKTALELTHLLDYLQHSPVGSLIIADFKSDHFLMKDGHIKLIDLDDLTSEEPRCKQPSEDKSPCSYNLQCNANKCDGFNAIHNLYNFNKLFFSKLLYSDIENNTEFSEDIYWIKSQVSLYNISAKQILNYLYRMTFMQYLPGYQ